MQAILNIEDFLEQKEKNDKRMSVLITLVLVTVFCILTFTWWKALLGFVPPPEESQYVMLLDGGGRMDYGDFTEGSSNVNNFQKTSSTPGPEEPAPSNVKPTESDPTPTTEKVLAGTEESDVKANPDPVKETPKETPKTPVKKTNVNDLYDPNAKGTAENGGANHGEGTKPGNRGNPDAKELYDDGGPYPGNGKGPGAGDGLDFGKLNGRKVITTPKPVYNVQQEAKLSFDFKITPNGSVSYVKKPVTPYTDLAKAGMDAIYKWKFNELEGDNLPDQWVSVTITFKLK